MSTLDRPSDVAPCGSTTPRRANVVTGGKTRDTAIDDLRTTITLLVVAHHSAMAYATFARLDPVRIVDSSAPVADAQRSVVFDLFVSVNDTWFMSLMFFISGLFVLPMIARQGVAGFLKDRSLRLGAPFAAAVLVIMPLAFYATWRLVGRDLGFADYYARLASGGFATGPAWFLWLLLFFDGIAAGLVAVLPGLRSPAVADRCGRFLAAPVTAFGAMVGVCLLIYVPAVMRAGFSTWSALGVAPFVYQVPRLGLYAAWFAFGVLAGPPSTSARLLNPGSALARQWKAWTALAIALSVVQICASRWGSATTFGPLADLWTSALWAAACVSGCFGMLSLFRRWAVRDSRTMRSLSRSAYGIYLIHYPVVIGLQYLLRPVPIWIGLKFIIVLSCAILVSFGISRVALRLKPIAAMI
jgi:glucans biosynthesis protein C